MADEPTTAPNAVPEKDIKDTPVDPGKTTEQAAIKAAETSAKREYTPSVDKGADKELNTFIRRSHEDGNPEQITPMQIEQNARDKGEEKSTLGKQHDMSHADTKWVVDNGLAS